MGNEHFNFTLRLDNSGAGAVASKVQTSRQAKDGTGQDVKERSLHSVHRAHSSLNKTGVPEHLPESASRNFVNGGDSLHG